MPRYYPVFLDIEARLAVVVGGDELARAKVDALLAVGARVRVVSASPTAALVSLAEHGALELRRRAYETGDLDGAAIAIAAPEDGTALEPIRADAERARVPLNVIDRAELCDWIAGSIVRRGRLVVAISTSGAAPALAVRLKERLREELGPEYGRFCELAAELRPTVAASGLDGEARRRLWYAIVDSEALAALRRGDEERARAVVRETIDAALAVTA